MSDPNPRYDRRTVIKATASAAAVAGFAGNASAHEFGGDHEASTSDDGHDHTDASQHDATSNVELLDYHSLGDVGPSSESGSPDSPHYGAISEMRVHGDYAYVSIFSSDNPTGDRGLAILDVSEFNAADNTKELRDAELEVVSFLRNDNAASAVMDVKPSDDGDYVFISKQPYTALFEETDPKPDDDGEGTSASASALQAVDVSDPANPQVVGTYDVWDTGPHNSWHHQIDGTDYVFAIKDLNDGTAALYVLQFERTTGALVLVNKWDLDGNLDDFGVTGGLNYIHDIVVQDDPELDRPVGYLSYWDAGMFALDLTDPTDISVLGHFTMDAAHYAEPAPTFIDGKRIVVAAQEKRSETDGSTGTVHLLDADDIGPDYDGEADNIHELDVWEWQSNATFENFTLSPHNFTITDDRWIHLAHYHGGTRFLRIKTGGWALEEKGYFQAAKDVPEDSKMEGLNSAAPFTWAAVAQEGVVYASDINTGVYAMRFKPSKSNSVLPWAAAAAGAGGLYKFRDRLAGVLGRNGGQTTENETDPKP